MAKSTQLPKWNCVNGQQSKWKRLNPFNVKDFVNPPSFTEGELVEIIGIDHEFLGYGYMAKQHKGVGWI